VSTTRSGRPVPMTGFLQRRRVPVRFGQSTGREGAMKKILMLLIIVAVGMLIARQIQHNHQG